VDEKRIPIMRLLVGFYYLLDRSANNLGNNKKIFLADAISLGTSAFPPCGQVAYLLWSKAAICNDALGLPGPTLIEWVSEIVTERA
jgi:hypothetical protein